MRPTTAFDKVSDINPLLYFGTIYSALSVSEKRAILASWASDAFAIASCCAFRAPVGLRTPFTSDLKHYANSTADLAIRRAGNQIVCIQRREP